ncbi:Retrovirus-related Pol polyprotein from transposon RE1 [Vitis vinifera]|uniref:Retrovirus-related Pol polyprotein from transposon RE1 n=1 Tax=Vitis vinifera TaxID=29760 RepID=A0A438FSE8_VITVI|nr:Retrovirus-related Pol polyprotein from transposon RE1 [Vitis vinifera]
MGRTLYSTMGACNTRMESHKLLSFHLFMISLFFFLIFFPYATSLSFNFSSFGSNNHNISFEEAGDAMYSLDGCIQLTINQNDKQSNDSWGRAIYSERLYLWDQTSRNLKTMRNRGFEPWTFRSCLGYQHFVINDNNRDQRKKDSKKTSTATVAEIKTEANVAEKASALVAATDHGDHMTFDSRQVSPLRPSSKKLFPQPMSKDSNKLQQALMADGSEGRRKSLKFGCGIDVWDMLPLPSCFVSVNFEKSPFPFMVIHSDVWGPSKVPTLSGSRWFVTFIDDCTRMTWLCLMKTKDEVNLLFQNFHKMIETQYNAKVRVLRSDNGGEYQSSDLQKYLEGHGIIHQTTCSNTPQQNGVAERKNRHLLEVVRASLIAAKTPISYWGEAITSAAYLINRTLDYDYHISKENESGQSELVNQEAAIPNSVQEALADPRWKAAMNEEMKSLQKNETWELVECPPGKKPVGCRWIYTVKYKADAANLDWPLQQFDVKNAFLHGELSEEVYMDLPPGCMVSEKQCQKVCKLKKSLYGLKQSPRAWFGRFTKSMRAFGYRQITGNDPEERKALQNYLSREFEMKDLGPLKYFLGIEVSRSSEGIFLSQRKYALDLLQETGMSGCQPVNTPIEEGLKLCVEPNQVSTDKGRYQRLVGRLMYLAHTRPDLAYALSVNAPGKGILFAKNVDHQSIEVYTDADWAGAVDDRRSTSGYFTFVGGNLVTWKSKKQNVVARSSAEAEFRGMALGLCEALWLRLLLQDLGYLSRQPIRLFCDNKAACDIAHNPVQHDRTKHVEVDRFFIKEKLDDKIVELPKIRSEDQLADILTKAVSSQVFSKFLDKLGMCDIYAPT